MHCFTEFMLFMYVANAECAITGGSVTFKFILLMCNNVYIVVEECWIKGCMYFITVT
jgi:hypothetical protein